MDRDPPSGGASRTGGGTLTRFAPCAQTVRRAGSRPGRRGTGRANFRPRRERRRSSELRGGLMDTRRLLVVAAVAGLGVAGGAGFTSAQASSAGPTHITIETTGVGTSSPTVSSRRPSATPSAATRSRPAARSPSRRGPTTRRLIHTRSPSSRRACSPRPRCRSRNASAAHRARAARSVTAQKPTAPESR